MQLQEIEPEFLGRATITVTKLTELTDLHNNKSSVFISQ